MPMANVIAVAAISHGSTRSAMRKKRVGLARSIQDIGGDPCFREWRSPTGERDCLASFHAMAQCRGGSERPEHDTHQCERAQDGKRGSEWDRTHDRRV